VKVKKFLECPLCMDVLCGKVYQYNSGHSVCEGCLRRVFAKKCSECRVALGDDPVRNRIVEGIAAAVSRPYRFEGCGFCGRAAEMEAHEAECALKVWNPPPPSPT
jgi:hypothetical protein